MQGSDIIMVNVTGTNGSQRHTKAITRRFSGVGIELDDDGQAKSGSTETLNDLPSGSAQKAPPAFPQTSFNAAAALGAAGLPKMKEIQAAYNQELAAYEQALGGGSPASKLVSSVLGYLQKVHNFSIEADDSSKFVVKRENLEVNTHTLADGRTLWTVTGTAIFGR